MNVVKIDLVSKQACLGRREPVCPGLTAAKLRIFHESRNINPPLLFKFRGMRGGFTEFFS